MALRSLVMVTGALVVTLGLYVMMDRMISTDRVRLVNTMDASPIEFVRSAQDDQTRTKDRRRKPPPKPQEIRKVRSELDTLVSTAQTLPMDMAAFDVKSLLGEGGGVALGQQLVEEENGNGAGEVALLMASELTPLAMLPPQYPRNALSRGIEGWVDIVFGVDQQGLVRDVTVRNAEPKGVFDRAAIAGAERWRFRPVMEDGKPVPVRATTRVQFELPKSSRGRR
ncbi:MAG: TonB family protein [Gammaproteobacteria bacterium]|nr:TonB family protein [Gammaproteobacteria bacterium]